MLNVREASHKQVCKVTFNFNLRFAELMHFIGLDGKAFGSCQLDFRNLYIFLSTLVSVADYGEC